MSTQRSRANRALISGVALSILSISSIAAPAIADTFTPLNDPPTSNNITLLEGSTSAIGFTPANPRSTNVYTVSTDVGSQGGLSNLTTVTLCIFNADNIDPSGAGVTPCANASTNPKDIFKMVWTQSTDSFAVTGTNNYQNVSSLSNYGDGTALTATMDFKFKVSNAMLQGSNWVIRVEAIDDQSQVSASGELSPVAVDYFGAVTTQRAAQNYGSLLGNTSAKAEGISTGSFIANGVSYLSLSASDFTYGQNTVSINGNNTQGPSSGEVALDCEVSPTYTGQNGIRVATTATSIDWNLFSGGTGESADSSHVHSCALVFGGGASVANVEYSNTVTVGIGWGI